MLAFLGWLWEGYCWWGFRKLWKRLPLWGQGMWSQEWEGEAEGDWERGGHGCWAKVLGMGTKVGVGFREWVCWFWLLDPPAGWKFFLFLRVMGLRV